MSQITNKRFSFSGHESFHCRNLWLKKGFEFIKKGKFFNDEDAVVELGVGKNMVSAIRYWMKAFGILDINDNLTEIAYKLLDNDGWDPYLEDEASLWLLHYNIVTGGYASIYNLVFNELRKEKVEFTADNLLSFIIRKADFLKINIHKKTVADDFEVMLKMYCKHDSKDKEDAFSGLLNELDIIHIDRSNKHFIIENSDKPNLSEFVVLYSIVADSRIDMSVSLRHLEQEPDSVASIFALSRSSIVNKINAITDNFPEISYSEQAGISELQFKRKPTPLEVLDKYYAGK